MSSTNAYNTQPQDTTTGKQQQPGYLEQAYNLASSTASNAYNSLAGTNNPTTNDPTTNYRNQQSHTGGVGDMGTKSDADVTRLPEERANPNPFTSGGTSEALENPNISNPTSIQQRLNARDPPNPYPEGNVGVGATSDRQFRNQQDHVGGVGDLGTNSNADVARLPDERANPNPLSNTTGATTGSTGFDPTRDRETFGRDNAGFDSARDNNTFGRDQPGFDSTRNRDRDFVNRDTTDRSQPTSNTADTVAVGAGAAAATAAGFEASRHHDRDTTSNTSSQSHNWRPEQKSWDTGNVVGTVHDPTQHGHSGGVTGSNADTDHGLGMPHREGIQRGNRDETALSGQQRDQQFAGAMDFQPGCDASNDVDMRDPSVTDRTQAPVGGVDTTGRHEDRFDTTDRRGDRFDSTNRTGDRIDTTNRTGDRFDSTDRTGDRFDSTNRTGDRFDTTDRTGDRFDDTNRTGDRFDNEGRQGDRLNRDDEDDTNLNPTDPASKPKGPGKLDKLHGKIMVAKGKLTKDDEAIAQGQRLQTEGVAVHPSDFIDERRE